MTRSSTPPGYPDWFAALKGRIRAVRLKADVAVNAELTALYWSIGRDILARQSDQGWGARVVGRLAADLRCEFPEMPRFFPASMLALRLRRGMVRPEPFAGAFGRSLSELVRRPHCIEARTCLFAFSRPSS